LPEASRPSPRDSFNACSALAPDPARVIAPIADVTETAGLSPKPATLMSIIEEFAKAKAGVKVATAGPVEPMRQLMKLLPVDVDYQEALRAANSEQLDAEKIGGRWFCTKRVMNDRLARTGQSER
jgi:hypothetical protein